MKDLFQTPLQLPTSEELRNDAKRYVTNPKARASNLPGPEGMNCRDCRHSYASRSSPVKNYYKCAIAQRAATRGSGTDIRLKDPACSRFEAEDGQE